MMPAARVQAAIDLLDEIIVAARDSGPAADIVIARYFKTRRYAGSKDRRAVRELVYRAIRRAGERPDTGRAAMLGLARDDADLIPLFDGTPHGPPAIADDEPAVEAAVTPLWLRDRFDPLIDDAELAALMERAPLDLRVNTLKASRAQVLEMLPEAAPTPLSQVGLRLPDGFAVEDHRAWLQGLCEVQDEGSQLLSLACGTAPGMAVVDLCAGAGGKTLALAAGMANEGQILAADTDRTRLSRLPERLGRAGVSIVESRLLNPCAELELLDDARGKADVVLVDAPCSGTGTWRRNPETRWRMDAGRLARVVNLQAHLLDVAADLVRPGGHLVYAVCSLLAEEGRGQARSFSDRHSGFVSVDLPIAFGRSSGPGRLLSPGHDGTDGFFVARWQAPC